MWEILEEQLGPIPKYLKNGLFYSGYDNVWSIGTLSYEDIEQIEQFIKKDIHKFMKPEDDPYSFYHFFRSPANFQIIPGHKKFLKVVADYISQKGPQVFISPITEKAFNTKRAYSREDTRTASTVSLTPKYQPPVPPKPVDLEEQTKKLKTIVNTWIRKQITEFNLSEDLLINDITVSYDLDTPGTDQQSALKGTAICSVCASTHKIFSMTYAGTGTRRWIISNFVKHFKKHLPVQQNDDDSFTDPKRHRFMLEGEESSLGDPLIKVEDARSFQGYDGGMSMAGHF